MTVSASDRVAVGDLPIFARTTVVYQATCGNADPVSGGLQVADKQNPDVWHATAELPVGDCMVVLTVNDDNGEAICIASVTFLVGLDETTKFNAIIVCGLPQ